MSDSIPALFDESVKQFSDQAAIQYFSNKNNAWVTKSWLDIAKKISMIADTLTKTGVKAGDRVAILSLTRPEWVLVDLAILKSSALCVPIYHSSLSDQISYVVNDADLRVIFVENDEQLKKIRQIQDQGKSLDRVIIFDQVGYDLRANEIYFDTYIEGASENFIGTKQDKDSLASLVYTSGTTGEPKGVMISHDNLISCAEAIYELELLTSKDVQLMFLPLAHIFARVLAVTWIKTGHMLAFARSIDKVVEDMSEVSPTLMAGVPRIFEKIRAKVMSKALSSGGMKKLLAQFAFCQADALASGKTRGGIKLLIAKNLVFKKIGEKINQTLGGRMRFLISGGAKLAPEVAVFFDLCGIMLCEGYGLTETSAATCLNLPWAKRRGSVGRALPKTEVRLGQGGEIMVRGRGVFKGFWRKDEQTKEVLSADGWFKTGDIGEIDADGYVKIVDRIKDIIVTSQGKNIAPARVENLVKSSTSLIAHVIAVGDDLPYLSALVALDRASTLDFLSQHNQVVDEEDQVPFNHHLVIDEIKMAIKYANESLANFEQIKKFRILEHEFNVGVELTPTLKVKRKECLKIFHKQIEMLY